MEAENRATEGGGSESSGAQDSSGSSSRGTADTEMTVPSITVDDKEDATQEALPTEDKPDDEELLKTFKEFDRRDLRTGYSKSYAKHVMSRYDSEELTGRIKQANKRWIQSSLFHSLVNDRLTELERTMRKLLDQPEQINDKLNSNKVLEYESDIAKLNWSQFAAPYELSERLTDWEHVPDINAGEKKVIEILTEEPRYGILGWLRSSRSINRRVNPSFKSTTQSAAARDQLQENDHNVPYRIRIRSPVLLKVLTQITGIEIAIGPHKHQVVFTRPFKVLTRHSKNILEELERLETSHKDANPCSKPTDPDPSSGLPAAGPLKESDSLKALQDLRLLRQLFETDMAPLLRLRQDIAEGKVRRISFADLWHIFKPGDEVRTPMERQIQLYRVMRVVGGRQVLDLINDPPTNSAGKKLKEKGYSEGSFVIECFYVDFDGVQYGPVNQTFQIAKFEGERDITTLPVFPFSCDPNHDEIRQKLLERGEKFATLSNPLKTAHMQYVGLTLDKHPEQVESQVIIDFRLAFVKMTDSKPVLGLENIVDYDERETTDIAYRCPYCDIQGCCGNDIIHPDYEIDVKEEHEFQNSSGRLINSTDKAEDLSEDQKLLLPCRVFGFVLRSRKWATFNMELIEPVRYTNGWDNLVIPGYIRNTVLAMVENHERPHKRGTSDGLSAVDLVQGKGKGLIILLHGEPGVGKTSTAECVADHTRRPLFPITCGDIGDNAESVEDHLERNFQLAHKWGCVLLLDEADVFLKRRSETDLTRNAIVSVFLRTLEYYSGILFLTTNRVGQIDRAFKSRIHVSLYYPRLDEDSSIRIWENNLTRIKEDFVADGRAFNINSTEIVRFARRHYRSLEKKELISWNGRQIRNAFQTAIALASFEANEKGAAPELGSRHFKLVAKTALEFDKYLQMLNQGKDDAQLAKEALWRLDDYEDDDLARSAPMIFDRMSYKPRRRSTVNGKRRKPTERVEDVSESTAPGFDTTSGLDTEDSADEKEAEPSSASSSSESMKNKKRRHKKKHLKEAPSSKKRRRE